MMGQDEKVGRRRRAVSLLALGLVVGIAMTAAPASGHVTGSVAHLVQHMKNVFYTKTQSDQRFANAIPGTDIARNADKVDGVNANGLTRVAGASTGEETEIVSPLPYLTLNITAPSAGFVLVNGSFTGFTSPAAAAQFRVAIVKTTPPTAFAPPQDERVYEGANEAAISTTQVFPVAAGVNTFQLQVSSFGSTAFTDWGQLTAIYSPFGSTGGTTLRANTTRVAGKD
jgi:hypothetical protein